MRRMLVLGATSEIAVATLHEFAKEEPWHMILCGRNLGELEKLKRDLESCKCTCEVKHYDTAMSSSEQLQLFEQCLGHDQATRQNLITYASKSDTEQTQAQQSLRDNVLNNAPNQALKSAHENNTLTEATNNASSDALECSPKESATPSTEKTQEQLTKAQGLDALFCAVGYLGDQKLAEQDVSECNLIMQANFNGLLPMLTAAAKYFKEQRSGSIMVVSSVAGERGRCSNYCYGSSKAAMTAFLSGMRCSLLPYNIQVMTIKPGYVATRMVAHKKLPPYITASTQTVAKDIVQGFKRRASVVYTMWLWRYIMAVVRLIPEFIFKRLNMF